MIGPRTLLLLFLVLSTMPLHGQISDIGAFLERCPQNDPAWDQIRSDFQIRRNHQPITSVPACSEPVSLMPASEWTDELVLMQALRVAYYMDRGQSGHLPWTDGTLYEWLRAEIDGIEITSEANFCCFREGTNAFVALQELSEVQREGAKRWSGIASRLGLLAHEARHAAFYMHDDCCGVAWACDRAFEPADLSAYGVQWWLIRALLDGTIHVGMPCLPVKELAATIATFTENLTESGSRFCTVSPPDLPPGLNGGGVCRATTNLVRRRAAR